MHRLYMVSTNNMQDMCRHMTWCQERHIMVLPLVTILIHHPDTQAKRKCQSHPLNKRPLLGEFQALIFLWSVGYKYCHVQPRTLSCSQHFLWAWLLISHASGLLVLPVGPALLLTSKSCLVFTSLLVMYISISQSRASCSVIDWRSLCVLPWLFPAIKSSARGFTCW